MKPEKRFRPAEMVEKHMTGGEGGVSAEIDLNGWRHPAQVEMAAPINQERGLGEIVLVSNCLHDGVREPGAVEQTDARGVAGERPVGEGSDLVIRYEHGVAHWSSRTGEGSSRRGFPLVSGGG